MPRQAAPAPSIWSILDRVIDGSILNAVILILALTFPLVTVAYTLALAWPVWSIGSILALYKAWRKKAPP